MQHHKIIIGAYTERKWEAKLAKQNEEKNIKNYIEPIYKQKKKLKTINNKQTILAFDIA